MGPIEFYMFENKDFKSEFLASEDISQDRKTAIMELVSFIGKAEWEGGIGEVAANWPDTVPVPIRWAAEAYAKAAEEFYKTFTAYCHTLGVQY